MPDRLRDAFIVEQFSTVVDMQTRINQLADEPGQYKYIPYLFTETTENFTVIFKLTNQYQRSLLA